MCVNAKNNCVNDADALTAAMKHAVVALRERLEMRQAARLTAEQNMWEEYGRRAVALVEKWIA